MSKRLHREFYLLTRGEQRGMIILSLLLILSLILRITVGMLPDREPGGLEDFEREARLLAASLEEADSIKQFRKDSTGESVRKYPAGTTYIAEQRTIKNPGARPIDINRADSADLLPLPGIGPVFAGRIIKYRDLLGGFVSPDQLKEVYGIPEETVLNIGSLISIDTSAVRKIRLDSADFRELLRHPYLEYEDVKALVEYREFNREINSVHELKINHILPDSTIRKLEGYFDYR